MPRLRRPTPRLTELRVAALLLAVGCGTGVAWAQPAKPAAAGTSATARPAAEQGPTWSSLTPSQRKALEPLERDWAGIDAPRKAKWLEIAERYPAMAPQDQARIKGRMTEWARMTPEQRNQTRLQYQQAKQVPAQDRQASWEAYKALPEDERRALASGRAAPPAASAAAPGTAARTSAATAALPSKRLGPEAPQPKVNVVSPPSAVPSPKSIAPSVVQAKPGATTTLISKPPAPPPHQPSGSPKIAATPEFVDKKTLLPQAGAQSEAVARPGAPAAAATARP